MINSGDIVKDESGQIMVRGKGALFLVICDDLDNPGWAKISRIVGGENKCLENPISVKCQFLDQLEFIRSLYDMEF